MSDSKPAKLLSERIRAACDTLPDFKAGGTYTPQMVEYLLGELHVWLTEARSMEGRLLYSFGQPYRPLVEGEPFQAPMSEIARRYQRVEAREDAA